MPTIKEITVYKFSELEGRAKERAAEKLREWAIDHEWYDCTKEDFESFAERMGFKDVKSWFSGFWSQGDGACFDYKGLDAEKLFNADCTGFEPYSAVVLEWRKNNAALIRQARRVQDSIWAESVTHNSRYSHSKTRYTSLYIDHLGLDCHTRLNAMIEELEKAVTELQRELSDQYYDVLEKEYEYITSDESISENADANEYEFDAQGRIV